MALVLLERFDDLSAWNISGTATVVAGRTGTAVQVSGTSGNNVRYLIPSGSRTDTLTIGFAWRYTDANTSVRDIINLRSDADAVLHNQITYTPSTSLLSFQRGTSPLQANNVTIAANTWAYIEVQCKLADTNAFYSVRVNGTDIISTSAAPGVDTKNGGTNTVYESVFLLADATGNTNQWDDFYLRNDTTFMGDMTLGTEARNARSSVRVAFSTATISADITATASVTLARLTAAASASVLSPAITAVTTTPLTLARLTAVASATLTSPAITSTANVTLARLTASAAGLTSPAITAGSTPGGVTLRRLQTNIRATVGRFVFIPPLTCDVAFIDEPFKHWNPMCRGENLWALQDGTYTINQPANNEGVVKVYYGGHYNVVSAAEYALLDAAGYGAFVIPETPEMALP